MRDYRFRDTRRRSPSCGKFRDAETCKRNRYPGSSLLEPERHRAIGSVGRTECDKRYYDGPGDGRSMNIPQYNSNKSVNHGESPSLKFQWNNLLEGKFENAKSSTKHVSDFGSPRYGIGISVDKGCSHRNGFPESGVAPIPTSIGTARNYRHTHGGFTSPVGKNEVGFQNSGLPTTWEQQYLATNSLRPLYDQDGDAITMPGCRATLGYGMSISQPKAFPDASSGYLKDKSRGLYEDDNLDLPRFSLGLSRSIEMPHGYFAQDGHDQIPYSNSTVFSEARLMELPDYGRVQPSSVELLDGDSNCTEIQRNQKGDRGVLPDDIRYRNKTELMGDNRGQDSQCPSVVDSIVDRIDGIPSSHGDTLRNRVLWEENLSSEEHSTPNYHDLTGASSKTEYYAVTLGSKNVLPEHGTEGYEHSEERSLNAYGRDANATTYQHSGKGLQVFDLDQYFYKQENRPKRMSITEELAMHDLDGEMLKLKRNSSTNESQIWTTRLSHSQSASETFHGPNFNGETSFDKDIIHVQFNDQLTSPYPPMHAQRNLRNHKNTVRKSIKKRSKAARPIAPTNSVVCSGRNVHERLGPRVVPMAYSFAGKHKKYNNSKRCLRNVCETAPCSDLSEVKVKHTKTEPPEDSKEFKHLVHNAFLKFVKLLNETPAQRRKYTNQGGFGTLMCGICGSKSKEFEDTLSLAKHAFKSSKSGCRAEHLGFHQALCVMLGWSYTVGPNGSWIQEMLPAAEASALKNDLIIWPPVVLVHNISVAHYNPDERMIVSIEGLEAILLDMGFGGGKTKVSRGKPANYSTLVVTFNATFSGLQEAGRLHKFYANSKRGRVEFQQIDNSDPKNSNDKAQFIPGNFESALYGYLGNAGDFDKLDFDSKKHSVVKSNKEIRAIAAATLIAD